MCTSMIPLYLVIFTVVNLVYSSDAQDVTDLCQNIKCKNGVCHRGLCKCAPCYVGTECLLMENAPPIFQQSSYHVIILQRPAAGERLTTVNADDSDKEKCDTSNCPCSTVIYSILDDKQSGIFRIDSKTGDLNLTQKEIVSNYEYSVEVKATNESPFDNFYDTATIFINFGKQDSDANQELKRIRRATAPTTLSFVLTQTFPTYNVSVAQLGQKFTFQLTITFPAIQSSLTVELFAPETNYAIMMLCNAVTTYGSSVSSPTIPAPTLEGINGSGWPYSRIIYKIGPQGHTISSPTNIADIQIVMTFDAFMLYQPDIVNATTYFVSAGAEYLNSTQIWVGQSGYSALITAAAPSPNITIVGDTAVYPGSTAAFDVIIYAPDSYLQLNIQFYAPFNDTTLLSFCYVNRYFVGLSYTCIPTTLGQSNLTSIIVNMKTYYTIATMNLGYITNQLKGDNTATGTEKDTIKIKMVMRSNPLAWIGGSTYVGVSISYTISNIMSVKQTLPITVKPAKTPYTNPIVATLDNFGVSTVEIGTMSQFLLNIIVPQSTDLDYTIVASFDSLNTEMCGFVIFSVGANVPCLTQVELTPTFTFSADNYQVTGRVTIPNVRHVPFSNLSSDDVLTVLIYFRPINDIRNSNGNIINSNVILLWNGGTSAKLTNSFTLTTASAPVVVANTDLPTFSFGLISNDGNISKLESRTLNFTITLKPGIVYSPVTLEFYMPFNTTTRMKICQATIVYIGKSVTCFNKDVMTQKFIYSSRVNDTTNYDKLSLSIGLLSSFGPVGRAATIFDSITILLDIFVLDHPMNVINTQTYINAGMLLTTTQIWVGTQNINFVTSVAYPALVAPNIPVLYGSRVDSPSNIVWVKDMAILQYIVKIAGSTKASLILTVSSNITTTDQFGICSMTIINKGSSIPCVLGTPTTTSWSATSKFNKTYSLQFNVINTGTTPLANPSFDENSILFEVIVMFGPTLPDFFKINALLTYNTGTVSLDIPFAVQRTLSRFNGTATSTEPTFSFFLMPLFNDTTTNVSIMGYGEALRAAICVELKPAALQSLTVGLASKAYIYNQMDVISVNIMSVGRNIPCLKPGMYDSTPSQRTSSSSTDMNTLIIGTICRKDVAGNTTADDNKIWIEVVFRVWRIPTDLPTSMEINAIGLVNNDQIYITKIVVSAGPTVDHIVETNNLNLNITSTVTISSNTLTLGTNVSINASIYLPPYTQFKSGMIRVYSIVPSGSDSALLVSEATNFTATFGSNVLFNAKENLALSSKSTMNTSQKDDVIVNLGISQNAATTYRMGKSNYSGPSPNDSITVLFTVRLSDNSAAVNAYSFNLIVGIEFGALKYNTTVPMTVSRTNTETITIDANTTLLTNNTIYTKNDEISISAIAKLVNGSQLECRDMAIHVAIPAIMKLSSIKNSSYTSPGYSILQTNNSLGGLVFKVPYFFFSEQLSVTFGVTLNQNTVLTRLRDQSILNIPIIYGCKTLNWTLNPMGNKYINNVTNIKIQVKGESITVSGCDNDLKVTDSSVIKDCAISAYLSPFLDGGPLKVRSNSGGMWKPHIRGGYYNRFRFISIMLGTWTTVSKVILTSSSVNKPQEISIYGTLDGRTYSFYATKSLSYTGNVAEAVLTNPQFNYLGIRVSITKTSTNDSETGLNIDLRGCPTPSVTTPAIDTCPASYTNPNTSLTNFYRRGYLYVAPHLFVCDDVPSKSSYLETYPRCFRTSDASTTIWQDMGPQIGKVIGYDVINKYVYGIGSDLKSFVMSADDGNTWISINEGGWIIARNYGNLNTATEIPWTVDTGFGPTLIDTGCVTYVAGAWRFCYDGVYNGGVRLLSWNDCCGL